MHTQMYKIDSQGFYCGLADDNTHSDFKTHVAPPSKPWGYYNVPKFDRVTMEWTMVDTNSYAPTSSTIEQLQEKPVIKVTKVDIDGSGWKIATSPDIDPNYFNELTVKVGSCISFELTIYKSGSTLPMSDAFRVPIVASDGRERIGLCRFELGVGKLDLTFNESGVWEVTEKQINMRLPVDRQFIFERVTVYVYA